MVRGVPAFTPDAPTRVLERLPDAVVFFAPPLRLIRSTSSCIERESFAGSIFVLTNLADDLKRGFGMRFNFAHIERWGTMGSARREALRTNRPSRSLWRNTTVLQCFSDPRDTSVTRGS
jgi:hypothetical protein